MKQEIIDLSKVVFIFTCTHHSVGCYNFDLLLNEDKLILTSFELQKFKFILKFAKGTNLDKYAFMQKAVITNNNYYFSIVDNELHLCFEKEYTLSNLMIEFYEVIGATVDKSNINNRRSS